MNRRDKSKKEKERQEETRTKLGIVGSLQQIDLVKKDLVTNKAQNVA